LNYFDSTDSKIYNFIKIDVYEIGPIYAYDTPFDAAHRVESNGVHNISIGQQLVKLRPEIDFSSHMCYFGIIKDQMRPLFVS